MSSGDINASSAVLNNFLSPASVATAIMAPRPLPALIVDLILKNTDPATLFTCSLVCSSWVYPARTRLFGTVTLQADHPTRNLQAFIQCLEASSLGIFIRKLVLHAKQQATINTHTLCAVLSRTKYLHALHLSNVSCNDTECGLFPLRADFQIGSLHIYHPGTVTDTCQNVLHVLGLFSRIDEFVLSYAERGPSTLRANIPSEALFVMPIPLRLSVGALRFGYFAHSDFYAEIFRRTRTREALKALSVQCSDLGPCYLRSLALLLLDARLSLQQLSLEFTDCFAASNEREKDMVNGGGALSMHCAAREHIADKLRPALASLDALDSFSLQVLLPAQMPDTSQAWSLIMCMLSALPTSSMRHLSLTLQDDIEKTTSFGDPWCKLRANWDNLRSLLETFPALQTVTFASTTSKCEPGSRHLEPLEAQHIQNQLSGFARRKILRFAPARPRKE